MLDIFETNLHLFDGDGGTATAGQSTAAESPAVSQQETGVTAPPATEQTPDRNAEYQKFLAQYKDLDDKRGRSPHGECGLKLGNLEPRHPRIRSLPAWGVWIEISCILQVRLRFLCRSPHGECGLK